VSAIAAMVVVAVTLVALSLRQPPVPMYPPTPSSPRDAGRGLVGPVLYTVDATSSEQWRYFSFRFGSVMENAGPKDWDLAFRRYQIIANGGREFPGGGGIVDLGEVAFADVKSVPDAGYQGNEGGPEPRNPAIAGWYSYSYFSHVLSPKPRVWAVRMADGRYAKIEFVSYYCPRSQPGCLTFRYVYQGDGSRVVEGEKSRPSSASAPISAASMPTATPRCGGLLAPLAKLAERTGAAVLGIMHLTKNPERPALYRANGSIAFIAAARLAFLVAKEPGSSRRIFVPIKNNLSAPAATLAYTIDDEGRLVWAPEPEEGVDADRLLAGSPAARKGSDEVDSRYLVSGVVV